MLFQERGVEPRSFPVPVFLLLSNFLLPSKRGAVFYAGGSCLLFYVPNWKALCETLSRCVESRENDPQQFALLAGRPELLVEKRRSYPYLPLSQHQDCSIVQATSQPLPFFFLRTPPG